MIVNGAPPKPHSLQRVQTLSTIAKTVTLIKAYKNFDSIFSVKNASYLPLHKNHDHAIHLVNRKQSLYRPIYRLSKNEWSIFKHTLTKT